MGIFFKFVVSIQYPLIDTLDGKANHQKSGQYAQQNPSNMKIEHCLSIEIEFM